MNRCHYIYSLLTILAFAVPVTCWAQPQYSSVFKHDAIAQKLTAGDVYFDGKYLPKLDRTLVSRLMSDNGTDLPLKFAFINHFPTHGGTFKSLRSYTNALQSWLGVQNSILVVRTPHAVSIATSDISKSQLDRILKRNGPLLKQNPIAGISDTVSDINGRLLQNDASAQESPSEYYHYNSNTVMPTTTPTFLSNDLFSTGFELLFGLFGIVFVIQLLKSLLTLVPERPIAEIRRQKVDADEVQPRGEVSTGAATQVQQLHQFVIENLLMLDKYLEVLPPSDQQVRARRARDRAAALDRQVQKLTVQLTPQNEERAQCLLEQACDYISCCKDAINLATNHTETTLGGISGRAENEPTIVFDAATPMQEEIPVDERGACFFCSKPCRISQLIVVNVTVDGQRRKVLVCADDMQIIRQGMVPRIRMVSTADGSVPWYLAPNYDPYCDYYVGTAYYSPNNGMRDGLPLGSTANAPINEQKSGISLAGDTSIAQKPNATSQRTHFTNHPQTLPVVVEVSPVVIVTNQG